MDTHKEQLDIIDENEKIIGKASRDEIHKKGLLHREVHVWLYTLDNKIIFQKRSPTKDTYPNLLDASIGGHVDLGETPEIASIKELQEESGISAEISELSFISKNTSKSTDPQTGKINNVIRYVYSYLYTGKIEELITEEGKGEGFFAYSPIELDHLNEESRGDFIPKMISKENISMYRMIIQRNKLHILEKMFGQANLYFEWYLVFGDSFMGKFYKDVVMSTPRLWNSIYLLDSYLETLTVLKDKDCERSKDVWFRNQLVLMFGLFDLATGSEINKEGVKPSFENRIKILLDSLDQESKVTLVSKYNSPNQLNDIKGVAMHIYNMRNSFSHNITEAEYKSKIERGDFSHSIKKTPSTITLKIHSNISHDRLVIMMYKALFMYLGFTNIEMDYKKYAY